MSSRDCSVYLVENHDEMLTLMKEQNVRSLPVVHIDAHSDLFGCKTVDIGSYLYHAVVNEFVSKIMWIVPEPFFSSSRILHRNLTQLGRQGLEIVQRDSSTGPIYGRIFGVDIWIGAAQSYRFSQGPVILDIDSDYFTCPFGLVPSSQVIVPWQDPCLLIDELRLAGIQSELTAVSISSASGHTPPQWRVLGTVLKQGLDDRAEHFPISRLVRGSRLYVTRKYAHATTEFKSALTSAQTDSERSAALLWLTLIYSEQNRIQEAARCFEVATDGDPGLMGSLPYLAVPNLQMNAKAVAVRVPQWSTVIAEPQVLAAWSLFLWHESPRLAGHLANVSLRKDPNLVDAHVSLAYIAIKEHNFSDAIDHFEIALQLMKSGALSVTDPTASDISPDGHNTNTLLRLSILRDIIVPLVHVGMRSRAERYFGFLSSLGLLSPHDQVRMSALLSIGSGSSMAWRLPHLLGPCLMSKARTLARSFGRTVDQVLAHRSIHRYL